MSRTVGYARIAPEDVTASMQESDLLAAGAEVVFLDLTESDRPADRPHWHACLTSLAAGDVLLVHRLDRLGRTERTVLHALVELRDRKVGVRSLTEPLVDTTSSSGPALLAMVTALVESRSETIREGTRLGLDRARGEGRVGGRPTVMTPPRTREARRLREAGSSVVQIAERLGVSKSSVGRALSKPVSPVSVAAAPRVFYRDVKPYDTPRSLSELAGPSTGRLDLPHRLHWGPESSVDLDTAAGRTKAYQAVLSEGSAADQAEFLDRRILVEMWPHLALPDRVRLLWEDRFPELTTQADSAERES